jgi:hypothetical protein
VRRIAAYSVAWGTPDDYATEHHRPIQTNEQARAMRDAHWRQLRKEGRDARRSVLRGQLRQYWTLGVPCNIWCDVYEIYER